MDNTAQAQELHHINDYKHTSKAEKEVVSVKHLNKFIALHHSSFAHLGLKEDSAGDDLPLSVVSNSDFVGMFMNWLVTDATWLNDSSKFLSYKSIMGYASAFKEYYCDKYRNENHPPPPFQQETWSRTLRKMTAKKTEHAQANNYNLIEQKETATTNDRRCIGSVCILSATASSAEFFHMINTMANVAGRGSDVAGTTKDHLTTSVIPSGLTNPRRIQQKVNRFKTSTSSHHTIVPHRDDFLLCFYFSLAYLFAMNSSRIHRDNTLFSMFAGKVFNKEGTQVMSNVSDQFNKLIDLYFNVMESYFEGEYHYITFVV